MKGCLRKRGLSLSKNIRAASQNPLNTSSFSQSRSFIDRVLPDDDQKQQQHQGIRNSRVLESFLLPPKDRQEPLSQSNLERSRKSTGCRKIQKWFEKDYACTEYLGGALRSSNRVQSEQKMILRSQVEKLWRQLGQIRTQREKTNYTLGQLQSNHEKKMIVLTKKRENLRERIRKQKESKIRFRTGIQPFESNVSRIDELNRILGELIKDIGSTFEG